MTITIVSLLDQVLNINLPTYTDYKFFSNLFESNDNGEILTVQIASKEFKSRLSVFDELSKTNKECLTMKNAPPFCSFIKKLYLCSKMSCTSMQITQVCRNQNSCQLITSFLNFPHKLFILSGL